MRKVHKDIGLLVREYRTKSGMTQLDLAAKLGYESTQFVSLFERGVSKIPFETLGQLIVILGIPEKKILKALVEAYESDISARIQSGKVKTA
jgi:transcriptional regulator with XRE-family HTH domain